MKKKGLMILITILFFSCINVYAEEINQSQENSNVQEQEIENNSFQQNKTNVENASVRGNNLIPDVIYSTHVQTYGWQEEKKDGELAGTTGQSKRLEAIKIRLNSTILGDIEYITYVQTYGWQSWQKNGELAGTTGQSKRLEAIKIKLTGELANNYDIYYRVHSQTYGWLGWAKNGETAGTIAQAKRLEGIEIKLVPKGTGEITGNSYNGPMASVNYKTHVQSYGWQDLVSNGELSGTTGQSKRVEAINIQIGHNEYLGTVKYQSYIAGIGWEDIEKGSSDISGTTGEGRALEAIKISLTDELSEKYDVYYRVHSKTFGWLGWAKNGEIAGTLGYGFRIEAIEIKLVIKGTGEATGSSYQEKETNLRYQAHVQSVGDQQEVHEGEMAGTMGMGKRLEALKIFVDSPLSGNIIYKSYSSDDTWTTDWITDNSITGTTGQSKPLYLIAINLTGEIAEKYDVYYRVHSEKYGWLGWAKNGETAGVTYYDIQAIEIKLYLKQDSSKNLLNTSNHYIESGFYKQDGYTYYKDKNGNNATDWITIMNTKYFFNSLGVMIGKNVKKVIDVSAHNDLIDWDTVVKYGDIDGVILRISAGCKVEDSKFKYNIEALKRLNIPYGIYIYSYAENKNEGKLYADFTVNMIENYSLDPRIGIFLDLEENGVTSYMGLSQYTQVVNGYMEVMTNKGYGNLTKIYTYKYMADTKLNSDNIRNQITWIAQYNHFCTYSGSYAGWQYSKTEKLPGISGNVDMSVWFTNF